MISPHFKIGLKKYWWLFPLGIALANVLIRHYWMVDNPLGRPDVSSYFHSWEKWSLGEFDAFRTPLYPLFIGLIIEAFPGSGVEIIVAVQSALYLGSVWALCLIARKYLKLPIWASLVGIIPYCVVSVYPMYASLILTDGIASSLIIFFTLAFLSSLSSPSLLRFIGLAIFTISLIALRPSFLFVPVAIAIVWIFYIIKGNHRLGSFLSIPVCGTFIVVFIYALIFKTHTGYFNISSVGDLNNVILEVPYVSESDSSEYPMHHAFKKALWVEEPSVEDFHVYWFLASDHPRETHIEIESLRDHNPDMNKRIWMECVRLSLGQRIFGNTVPFWILPLLGFLYFPFLYLERRNSSTVFKGIIALLFWGNLAVVILAAPGEYPRLMMPVYSLFFIIVGDAIQSVLDVVRRCLQGNRGIR